MRNEISDIIMTNFRKVAQTFNKKVDLTNSPEETALYGAKGFLDSLGLVNLIVAVETSIEDKFNIQITLADEKAISQENSPFNTVESLTNYILTQIEENRST